jgi:histidinol-phosphate/aromatic aminotransferase/cobyric acid decarboxylase-like protein
MRFTLRLVVAIWISVMLVIAGFAFLQVREERARLLADLERRAMLLGEGLREAIEPVVGRGSTASIERILKKFGKPQRGIAVYDRFFGMFLVSTEVSVIVLVWLLVV